MREKSVEIGDENHGTNRLMFWSFPLERIGKDRRILLSFCERER